MASKHNDDKGYERGAKGIDGRDGESFVKGRYPSGGAAVACGKISGEDGGPSGKSGRGALMKSAKGK